MSFEFINQQTLKTYTLYKEVLTLPTLMSSITYRRGLFFAEIPARNITAPKGTYEIIRIQINVAGSIVGISNTHTYNIS